MIVPPPVTVRPALAVRFADGPIVSPPGTVTAPVTLPMPFQNPPCASSVELIFPVYVVPWKTRLEKLIDPPADESTVGLAMVPEPVTAPLVIVAVPVPPSVPVTCSDPEIESPCVATVPL